MPNLTLGNVQIEKYSKDGIGIFGYVPPDWENPWIKTYQSSHAAIVTVRGLSLDNQIIPFIIFQESVDVEGHSFETEDMGLYENVNGGRAENVLISYSPEGIVELGSNIYPIRREDL